MKIGSAHISSIAATFIQDEIALDGKPVVCAAAFVFRYHQKKPKLPRKVIGNFVMSAENSQT